MKPLLSRLAFAGVTPVRRRHQTQSILPRRLTTDGVRLCKPRAMADRRRDFLPRASSQQNSRLLRNEDRRAVGSDSQRAERSNPLFACREEDQRTQLDRTAAEK